MIWTDGTVKKCIQDTNYSPAEYAQAWEDAQWHMENAEISRLVTNQNGLLNPDLYRSVCESPQVDHILRNGDRYHIWANDGQHWEVTVKPD